MNTHCPNCNSNNTQAARMVIASGTRGWSGAGVGMGLNSGHVGLGLFGGVSQSSLAAMLSPGEKPNYIYPVLATLLMVPMFVAVLALVFNVLAIGLSVIFALLLGAIWFLRYRQRRVVWFDRVSKLDHTWLCRKCGCTFEA